MLLNHINLYWIAQFLEFIPSHFMFFSVGNGFFYLNEIKCHPFSILILTDPAYVATNGWNIFYKLLLISTFITKSNASQTICLILLIMDAMDLTGLDPKRRNSILVVVMFQIDPTMASGKPKIGPTKNCIKLHLNVLLNFFSNLSIQWH